MANNTTACPVSFPTSPTLRAATFRATAYFFITILAILGNIFVITVVSQSRRLRSVTLNQLIVSMAVADLLTSMFSMSAEIWIHVESALGRQSVWFDGLLGVVLCKLIVFVQGTSIACSVSTLTAIAVNRFFAVLYPLRTGRSTAYSTITIATIWLLSSATASPMLYAMKVKQVDGAFHCMELWSSSSTYNSSEKIYTLFLLVFLYVFPLATITVLYSAVVRKVWRRQVPGIAIAPNRLVELFTKKRVLRMLMTVVVVFGLCWLPYYTYLLLFFVIYDRPRCGPPANIVFFGLFLGHANSAINPCIYAVFNKEYRAGLASFHHACLSMVHGSKTTRRPNQSIMKKILFPTEDTARERGGRKTHV